MTTTCTDPGTLVTLDIEAAEVLRQMRNVPDWHKDALCAERAPASFFSMHPQTMAKAKAVCEQCLVKAECLDYAIKAEVVGVWGGTTTGERKQLRSK